MKITSVKAIPVSVEVGKFKDGMHQVTGRDAPSRYYEGFPQKERRTRNANGHMVLSNIIVTIETDEGISGIGEASCDIPEPTEVVLDLIERHMAPLIIGEDPFKRDYLLDQLSWDSARGATRFATSGFDLALYDLAGKALGVPVYQLLGGMRRNKVLASIEVPRATPEQMAEHSFEYYERGVRGIKAKIGSDPDRDAECIAAIREKLGPHVSLRADANCGFTVKEAIRFCKLVEKLDVNLEVLEQPVATKDLAGTRQVMHATEIPIELDEGAYSLEQVFEILKTESADLINTKCAKAGGIRGVCAWAKVAEAANRSIVIGTEWGFGLKVAAKLHLGAAIKNASPVVELTEIMIHDLLLRDELLLNDGYLSVPTQPGLGIELDDEKIAGLREAEK